MLSVQRSQQSRLFWGNYKLSYQNGHLAAKSAGVGSREGCGAVSSANNRGYKLVIPPTFFFVQGPGDNIVIRVAQITPDLVARFRGCRKAGIS